MKITRKQLASSMMFPFLMVFLFGVGFAFYDHTADMALQAFIKLVFMLMPLWGLIILVCYLYQRVKFKTLTDKKSLRYLLMGETLIAATMSFNAFVIILILGTVGNIIRYQWLTRRKIA